MHTRAVYATAANSSVRIPSAPEKIRTGRIQGRKGPMLKRYRFEGIVEQNGLRFPRGTGSDRYFLFREGYTWPSRLEDRSLSSRFGPVLDSNHIHRRE